MDSLDQQACITRFRYYNPNSGQYTQQDPIGLEGVTVLLQTLAQSKG